MLICLSWLTSNPITFLTITAAILYLSIQQFSIYRKYYKRMLNAVRKDVPIWRILVGIVLFVVYMNMELPVFDMDRIHFIYPLIAFAFMYFGLHYQRHQNSLRSFEEGLVLPGKESQLIPWESIVAMNIDQEQLELRHHDRLEIIEIDRRDLKEMVAIVETWRNTTAK